MSLDYSFKNKDLKINGRIRPLNTNFNFINILSNSKGSFFIYDDSDERNGGFFSFVKEKNSFIKILGNVDFKDKLKFNRVDLTPYKFKLEMDECFIEFFLAEFNCLRVDFKNIGGINIEILVDYLGSLIRKNSISKDQLEIKRDGDVFYLSKSNLLDKIIGLKSNFDLNNFKFEDGFLKINPEIQKGYFIFSFASSKDEIIKNFNIIESKQERLEELEEDLFNSVLTKEIEENVIPVAHLNSFYLSQFSLFHFLNKSIKLNGHSSPIHRAFPFKPSFSIFDEVLSLNGFFYNEPEMVRKKLIEFLNLIGDNGLIRYNGIEYSKDLSLWVVKVFGDFLFYLNSNDGLNLWDFFSKDDINKVYLKMNYLFKNLIENYWNSNNEEVKITKKDTFLKEFDFNSSLDFSFLLLNLVGNLVNISAILNKKYDEDSFLDLEEVMRERVRDNFFRNGILYLDREKDIVSIIPFLAYEIYPNLLTQYDWERVFEKIIPILKNSNGDFQIFGKYTKRSEIFKKKEIHHKINLNSVNSYLELTMALSLLRLNSKKFRPIINNIISKYSNIILENVPIGYIYDFKFSKKINYANLISTSKYVELIVKNYMNK